MSTETSSWSAVGDFLAKTLDQAGQIYVAKEQAKAAAQPRSAPAVTPSPMPSPATAPVSQPGVIHQLQSAAFDVPWDKVLIISVVVLVGALALKAGGVK
jgi:hypothetical protein